MNSDQKRILRSFEQSYDNPDISQTYYDRDRLWERVSNPAYVLLPALVLAVTVVCQLYLQNGQVPPLAELLWNALVYVIPAKLLDAVDAWLHPPLFPASMLLLQTQPRTHAAKSDVLRRVLGMDKAGGIIMSVSQAGRRSLSNLSSGTLGFKGTTDQPPGLGNYDNSCYQNSILQSLATLKPLRTYLAGLPVDGERDRPTARTTDALRELLADLNDASNNGRTLWTPAVLKNMSTWQQQDAQEYYSKLLDEIDKEVSRAAKGLQKPAGFENECAKDESAASQHSDDSGYQSLSNHFKAGAELRFVKNPLEGLTAQRVACVACGHSDGLSMIPFNCLTLNLGVDQDEYDLYERLDGYTRVEYIQGVECAKCTLLKFRKMLNILMERNRQAGRRDEDFPEPLVRLRAIETALEEDDFDDRTLARTCKIPANGRVSSTKTKQTVVARPPQSLAIHMNRSVFDEATGHMFKNPAAVKFPMVLDLGPWCLGSADGPGGHVGGGPADAEGAPAAPTATGQNTTERWLLDPTSSLVAGDQEPSRITGPIYELRAVVTHQGRHENGHYVCFRRHPRGVSAGHARTGAKRRGLAAEDYHHPDDVSSLGGRCRDESAEEETPAEEGTCYEQMSDEEPDSPWWRLSDQDVTMVDEATVLGQGGVFMLFYDCVDPNSILTSDVEAFTGSSPNDDGSATPNDSMGERRPGTLSPPPQQHPAPLVPAEPLGQSPRTSGELEDVLERAGSVPLPGGDDDEDLV